MSGIADPIVIGFQLLVVLFSVVIHEVSHGATALALGDTTAKDAGRLTLNPLKHLDPFWSVILPATMLALTAGSAGGAVVFGAAKPVPYNPYALRRARAGTALVGLAGPLANIVLAVIFGIALRILASQTDLGTTERTIAAAFLSIVYVNLYLAFFNLLPFPPLDGSKLLFALLPERFSAFASFLERYGVYLFIFFVFSFSPYIGEAVRFVVHEVVFLGGGA